MGKGLSELQKVILIVGYQNEGKLAYPFYERKGKGGEKVILSFEKPLTNQIY